MRKKNMLALLAVVLLISCTLAGNIFAQDVAVETPGQSPSTEVTAAEPEPATPTVSPAVEETTALPQAETDVVPDMVLRGAINGALGVADPAAPVSSAQMATLTKLSVSSEGVTSLEGLQYATTLDEIRIQKAEEISSYAPLGQCVSMRNLILRGAVQLTDAQLNNTISKLNLRNFSVSGAPISDLNFTKQMPNLSNLSIADSNIEDLTPLKNNQTIRFLHLNGGKIKDVSPLTAVPNLFNLWLQDNEIEDLSPLKDCTGLLWLVASGNHIADIGTLAQGPLASTLVYLDLWENGITDPMPLIGFKNLYYLGLAGNHISDLSFWNQMSKKPISVRLNDQTIYIPFAQFDASLKTANPLRNPASAIVDVTANESLSSVGNSIQISQEQFDKLNGTGAELSTEFSYDLGDGTFHAMDGSMDQSDKPAAYSGRVIVQLPLAEKVTVTFDSDGGSPVDPQTIDKGAAAVQPADPQKAGYTFGGWHLNGQPYDFNSTVEADITLKAMWTKNPIPPSDKLTPSAPSDPTPGSASEQTTHTPKMGDSGGSLPFLLLLLSGGFLLAGTARVSGRRS